MTFNLTQIELINFVSWCKYFSKRFNHEHIALYLYLFKIIQESHQLSIYNEKKYYVSIDTKKLYKEFLTIINEKSLSKALQELKTVSLIDYDFCIDENKKEVFIYIINLPFLFLHYNKFAKLKKSDAKFILHYLNYLIEHKRFRINSPLYEKLSGYLLLFNSILDSSHELFQEFLELSVDHKKELTESLNLTKQKKNLTRNLSEDEFNVLYPAIRIWNETADDFPILTKHRISGIIDKPVGVQLQRSAKILLAIQKQDFDTIPNVFKIFQGKRLTLELLQKSISQFVQVKNTKNQKSSLSFYSFIYNPIKDFSWLCSYVKFPKINSEKNILITDSYKIYESLIFEPDLLYHAKKSKVIIAVNSLYDEFDYIRRTVGWFHKSNSPSYYFNIWDEFVKEHTHFLKKHYGIVKSSYIKPRIYNGQFSASYKKFIDYVADLYGFVLYPTPKEMKILLQLRSLKLSKKKLLSNNHSSLTEKEFELYLKKEIELLYDDSA